MCYISFLLMLPPAAAKTLSSTISHIPILAYPRPGWEQSPAGCDQVRRGRAGPLRLVEARPPVGRP